MVGLSRLERLTSPLSAGCSNQLSYRPESNITNDFTIISLLHLQESVNGLMQPRWILIYLPRKEVIQPQVLLQLPCYDLTPITLHTFSTRLSCELAKVISGTNSFRGLTGGVYKVRERIHRIVLICDY